MARRGLTKKAKRAPKKKKQEKIDLSPPEQATPEMRARVEFDFGPVLDEMNVRIGAAYRRRPLYVTMAKKADRFTWEQLNAMRLYRSVFDRCERSPMGCALSVGSAGGRGLMPSSFIHASPGVVEAKRKLAMLERDLGASLSTLRSVILEDKSFSVIAMERFGCRTRSWIIIDEPVILKGRPAMADGKPITRAVHREDIVPRSGRDRAVIAKEFYSGLKLLTEAVDRMSEAGVHEVWVHVRDDGTAIIHRASLAPNGTFRMWGHPGIVETVLNRLLERNDDRLIFPTPEAARDALQEAADGALSQLEPDELAA